MADPIFYLDTDTANELLHAGYGIPQEEFDLIAEFTDIPYWAALHFLKTRITVSVYRRMEFHQPNEKTCELLGKVTDHRNGRANISAAEEISDNIGSIYWVCLLICDMMRGLNRKMPEEGGGGIMLRHSDGEWLRLPVYGKQRPDLMVSALFGGNVMCRPYPEDVFERDIIEMMDLEDLLKCAEDGDTACMKRLAMMFLNGDEERNAEPDPEKAVYWFRKAAEAGDSDGMFSIALHLAKGYGVQRNFGEAAEWMKKAEEAGDPDAWKIAIEYRLMAVNLGKAEAGDAKAQSDLADALVRHAGDLQQAGPVADCAEAARWYRESLKQTGDPKTAGKLEKVLKVCAVH